MSLRADIMSLFPGAKEQNGYIRIRCPYHKHGQERHPSLSILTEDKENLKAGYCKCFSADTLLFTREGEVTIGSIVGKPVQIINGNGEWETVIFQSCGHSYITELYLTRNMIKKVIRTTSDHLWFREGRVNPAPTSVLRKNNVLKSQWLKQKKPFVFDSVAYTHGFIYGDGRLVYTCKGGKYSSRGRKDCAGLNTYEAPVFDVKKEAGLIGIEGYTHFKKPIYYKEGTAPQIGTLKVESYDNWRSLPSDDKSLSYWFNFIAGYFVADGCVPEGGATPVIESACKEDLVKIAYILQCLGIPNTGVTTSLTRGNSASTWVVSEIGREDYRLCFPRSQIPEEFWVSPLKRPTTINKFQKLKWWVEKTVETKDYEEVFCCKTSTGSFVLSDNILTHNCFTCNWSGTFKDLAADMGYEYVPDTYALATKEKSAAPVLRTEQSVYKKNVPYKFSPYLLGRGIDEETQKLFKVYEKEEEQKVYMPVFAKNGKFLYANARSTDKKMFFVQSNIKKTLAGIEEVNLSKPIAICESQIDAMTFYAAGFCRAVATLGVANVDSLKDIKEAIGPFFLAFDSDEYGNKAAEAAKKYLGSYRCKRIDFGEYKDANGLWQYLKFDGEKFEKFIEENMK